MREKKFFEIESPRIPIDNLSGKYKKSWVEESFDFDSRSQRQIPTAHTKTFLGSSMSGKRVNFLFYLILGIFVVFTVRLIGMQIVQGDKYRLIAEGNRVRLRPIPAERGIIFDKFDRELVQNVPNFSLSVVPQDLPRNAVERYEIIKKISEMSGVPQTDIEEIINKYKFYSYESLVIKENLSYETALKLYIQNADFPGILIEKGTKRHYLLDETTNTLSLSHLLGYLSKLNETELEKLKTYGYLPSDYIGRTGLEDVYEKELRGQYGRKKIEVNALGKEQTVLAEEPPSPGYNLKLTIDLEAQSQLESIVKKTLKLSGKKRAAAIAMEPDTGAVLAMVSWPAFDDNEFADGIDVETYKKYSEDTDRPLFNRAISGTYPSGSTAKLIVAAAALQEKIINESTSFLSTGGLQVDKWLFKDWKAGGHGVTNVTKALAWSVNTFFYYISGGYNNFVGLGADTIAAYMRKFNLGQTTGIDLPGEKGGFVPDKKWKEDVVGEKWYVGDTYNLSIGQGNLLVTPLQVAVWTSVIANGGSIVKPHLAYSFTDTVNKKEIKIAPQIINDGFISPQNITVVKRGLRECVAAGSCQLLQTLPFSSGGKTGTAQWGQDKDNHAWFTAFAPYDNPKIVVTVLVEEGEEGSTIAMPIARDFLSWWGAKYL